MALYKRTTKSARKIASRFILALCLSSSASASYAAGPASMSMKLTQTLRTISEGEPSLAPFAFIKFCVGNPDQCKDTGGTQTVEFDKHRKSQLNQVNRRINRLIRPRYDQPGKDNWRVDVSEGDCEDYALTKKKLLLQLGWSSRALRIAVVITGSGEGHAVLVVKTTAGDLVLDNRYNEIKKWSDTDLRWVKIQSAENPKLWHSLERQYIRLPELISAEGEQAHTGPQPLAVSNEGSSRPTSSAIKIAARSSISVLDGATFDFSGYRYRLLGVATAGRNELCQDTKGLSFPQAAGKT